MRLLAGFVAISLLLAAGGVCAGSVETIKGRGDYAVVVSRKTYGEKGWRAVVDALVKKHGASVVICSEDVTEAREALAGVFPRHVCFVARPTEAGREYVVAVHRLTRKLDDDPYTDVLWGILTGYEPSDALRIARHAPPLLVRRGAAGCGLNLKAFREGRWYSEGQKNVMWRKLPGGQPEKRRCPSDTTVALVDMLNTYRPDLFLTSGHATQHDWQIGYSYRNGQLRCSGGKLFGLDLARRRHEVRSPNPKVYLASGNCLAGLIDSRETMALAWMRSGGVHQLVGYVVSTWYGYGGWGTKDLFVGQAGRFTLAEAFYLNNQALVYELESRFPRAARTDIDQWNMERDRSLLNKLARKHRIREKDALGMLWDRDTVAFYGDPAWRARMDRQHALAWKQELTEKKGTFTFTVATREAGSWPRPPMAMLPYRVKDVKVTAGKELSAVITDNFILLPRRGKFAKGESYKVVFSARRRKGPRATSRAAGAPEKQRQTAEPCH